MAQSAFSRAVDVELTSLCDGGLERRPHSMMGGFFEDMSMVQQPGLLESHIPHIHHC